MFSLRALWTIKQDKHYFSRNCISGNYLTTTTTTTATKTVNGIKKKKKNWREITTALRQLAITSTA